LNFAQDRNPANKIGGIVFVVVLHIFLVYALVTGLARKAIEVIKQPIETKIIEEVKPPPPDTPPPPPPPKLAAPPPPYIPPPEIQIATPPPVNAIQTVTQVKPPDNHLPPPPVEAPPAPTGVRVPAVVDPVKGCRGKPAYPAMSQRLGEVGSVVLEFTIEADGSVLDAKIKESSGHNRLDEAARVGLSSLCKFKPGTLDGKPERSVFLFKYTFKPGDE
jgi:protein TonB